MYGLNPVRALRVLQGINAEVVSYGKDVVLNKYNLDGYNYKKKSK